MNNRVKAASLAALTLALASPASALDVVMRVERGGSSVSPPDATNPTPTLSRRAYTNGVPSDSDVVHPTEDPARVS